MGVKTRFFVHPADRAALEKLKSIPVFTSCIKMYMKLYDEKLAYAQSLANKIQLGPKQLPEIYQLLLPICQVLSIKEPEFYLEMNPYPNAYTQGETKTFITVTSGLLESFEEDEIQAVIAHECGHIACNHVLYRTMAEMLLKSGTTLYKPLTIASVPIRLALLYWYRRSELSADRAAAVAVGGSKSVVETMIRLAGGPKSITEKVNVDLYMKQTGDYDKLSDSFWDKIIHTYHYMYNEHPLLSVRSREIHQWCQSEQFKTVMQYVNEEKVSAKCPGCGSFIKGNWKFCGSCGYQKIGITNATPNSVTAPTN